MKRRIKRATSHRASIIGMVVMVVILTCCLLAIVWSCKSCPKAAVPTPKKEAENLVIETPEPCRTGTVTIESSGQVIYQYDGEINIINDGYNGENIDIVINYPDENVPGLKGE